MTQSRTKKHREDPTKANGVHYTPRLLADFLARRALAAADTVETVLDPACGGGELLEAVARNHAQPGALHLLGIDIDSNSADTTAQRLASVSPKSRHTTQVADFLEIARPRRELDLFASPPTSILPPVDLAIANPPYVRTQTLGAETAGLLARRYGLSGRVDLFTAFAFAMTDCLRPGGILALLCSNRFLTTKSGEPLRRLLLSDLSLVSVTDFGDTKLFEAAVLPAIVIARKTKSDRKSVSFTSIYRTVETNVGPSFDNVVEAVESRAAGSVVTEQGCFRIKRGSLPSTINSSDPWTVADSSVTEILRRISASSTTTIGDLLRIRVGIKTTADTVFIRDDWDRLAPEIRPESTLIRPLLTHHVVQKWSAELPTKQVLYTHEDKGGRAAAIDLQQFPRAAAYLETHRARLEARSYVRSAGRNWYEIWVPQKPGAWAGPKVVFPDIAESPRFCVDKSGAIVNGDCYWATCRSEDEALLVAAIGNSEFARWFYDAQCGNQLYAGRRRFMTQYVERFPIPDPGSPLAEKIVGIARGLGSGGSPDGESEKEIDAILCESFGIEEALW